MVFPSVPAAQLATSSVSSRHTSAWGRGFMAARCRIVRMGYRTARVLVASIRRVHSCYRPADRSIDGSPNYIGEPGQVLGYAIGIIARRDSVGDLIGHVATQPRHHRRPAPWPGSQSKNSRTVLTWS